MDQAQRKKIAAAAEHLEEGRFAKGRALVEELRAAAPTDKSIRLLWAETALRANNDPHGAIAEARRLLEEEPENYNYLTLVSSAASALGDKALAVDVLERCIAAAPGRSSAYLRLMRAAPEAGSRHEAAIEALTRHPSTSARERAQALCALGLVRERRKDHAGAFTAFVKAKLADSTPYNAEGYELALRRSRERFKPAYFAAEASWARRSNPDEPRLVFVMGLPRSGSTLLERMLLCHSQVASVGETAEMQHLVGEHFSELAVTAGREARLSSVFPEIEGVLRASTASRAAAAEDYLSRLEPLLAGRRGAVWIEKLPANIFYAGAIAMMFPTARFVITDREPRDVFLSALRTKFAARQPFSESFDRFAHHYKIVKAFTRLWGRVLGSRVTVARYENVVTAPEDEARRLVTHIGLDWEDACASAELERGQAVHTASSWQVREPIHVKSVGAWRRYETQLAPLEKMLPPAGGRPATRPTPTPTVTPEARTDVSHAGA